MIVKCENCGMTLAVNREEKEIEICWNCKKQWRKNGTLVSVADRNC